MSGHKRATVTISQAEYRRLYDAEQKNVYSAVDIPLNDIQTINQQSNDQMIRQVNDLSQRQDRYLNTIKNLTEKIQNLEYEASKSLVDQQTDFYNQLSLTSENIWKNAENFIETQSRQMNDQIIIQHDQMQSQILNLENKINRQNKDKQAVYDTSIDWINNSIAVLEFIRNNYQVNEEYSDELGAYENQLNMAISNFNNHFFEASLSGAQQVCSFLTRLRLRLEKKEAEKMTITVALTNQCNAILEKIQINQTCKAMDIQGNILDQDLIVDAWVDGKLIALQSEVVEFITCLNSEDCSMENEELFYYLKYYVDEKNQQLEDLIRDARYYALNSQLRFNIAQQVMLSLVEQGFRPVEGGFSEDNFNGKYLARAINHDGGEVTIAIDPDEKIPLRNDINILSKDAAVLTEHELRQRSGEIRSSLLKNGLVVSDPVEVVEKQSLTKPPQRIHKVGNKINKLDA